MEQLPKIVLFGDSLTEWGFFEDNAGFGWALQEYYEGKAEVLNEGRAGYTSTMLKPDFEHIVRRAQEPNAPPTRLFTIFLGANDACLPPWTGHVTLAEYEANLRYFVETILSEKAMTETKVVLITPPPINIHEPLPDYPIRPDSEDFQVDVEEEKNSRGYRTYMNKKRYADKVIEIAESYEKVTDRVIGLNLWKSLIDSALEHEGRLTSVDAYDENKLPGCGLPEAKEFRKGYFTDGLHFGPLTYELLSKELIAAVLQKWPELGIEESELEVESKLKIEEV